MEESSSAGEVGNGILVSFMEYLDTKLPNDAEIHLSQCVRRVFTSKQRPFPIVKEVMNRKEVDSKAVLAFHSLMLREIDDLSRIDANKRGSLQKVKGIALVLYFVQLSLSWTREDNIPGFNQSERIKLAISSIQATCAACGTAMRAWGEGKVANETAEFSMEKSIVSSTCLHMPSVVVFLIGSLLRTINPFVATVPPMLSPLWKGICDLTASRLSPILPVDVIQEALTTLVLHCQDCLKRCFTALSSLIARTQPFPVVSKHQATEVMFLTFLLARLDSLLPFCWKSIRTNSEGDGFDAIGNVWKLLCSLMGMVKGTGFYLEQAKLPSDQVASYNQMFEKLAPYIERCVATLVRNAAPTDLLITEISSRDPCDLKQRISSVCWRFGNIFLLDQLLEHLPLSDTKDVESLLLLVRKSILFTIPSCHKFVFLGGRAQKQTGSITIQTCLSRIITSSVVLMVKSSSGRRMGQIQILLASWLDTSVASHPLSREVLIELVCRYIVSLSTFPCSSNGSPRSVDMTPPTAKTRQFADRALGAFLNLLVGMVFESRTTTQHRRSVASVLIRLLHTSKPRLRERLSELVSRYLTNHFTTTAKMNPQQRSKGNGFTYEDALVISSVIGSARPKCCVDKMIARRSFAKIPANELTVILSVLRASLKQQSLDQAQSTHVLTLARNWFQQIRRRGPKALQTTQSIQRSASVLNFIAAALECPESQKLNRGELRRAAFVGVETCTEAIAMNSRSAMSILLVEAVAAVLGEVGGVVHGSDDIKVMLNAR